MPATITSLLQLTFFASVGIGLLLLFALYKFRHANPGGYFQIAVLIISFELIIFEQWIIWLNPELWSVFNRSTTWIPLLFGPCFWLFAQSLDKPQKLTLKTVGRHYLPAFVCLAYFLPYLLLSEADKMARRSNEVPLETFILVAVKMLSMATYLVISQRHVSQLQQKLQDPLTRWIGVLLRFFMLVIVLITIIFFVEAKFGVLLIPSDVFAALSLGVTIYFSAFLAISCWSGFVRVLPKLDPEPTTEKTARQLLESDDTQAIYQDICTRMETEQLFLEANLKSESLAELLNLPVHYLSYVVNAQFEDNVQIWINSFRVAHVKAQLTANPDLPLLELGLASGFNSKATFNRVFKRFVDLTPSQFRDRVTAPDG